MFIKIVLSLVFIGLLVVPQVVFTQDFDCYKMRDLCISKAENQYNECVENCGDPEVLEATTIPACIAEGYKLSSLKYQECIEEYIKGCKQICKEDYHKGTEFCSDCYKKCRKGDIFGTIQMSFVVKSSDENENFERKGSFTVVGIWKFQPEESTKKGKKGLKTFSESYTQVIYNYYENETIYRRECTLHNYLHHSSAPMPYCPECGPSKIYIADIPNMWSIYTVAYRGMIAILEGKKRDDCDEGYKDYSRQITIGAFTVSDDVKRIGEMSGSDSWNSCGNAFQDNVDFTINRNKQVAKLGKVQYSPKKREGCVGHRGSDNVSISVNWKFYLIK